MDRIMAELSPAEADYKELFNDLEEIAVRILAAENISLSSVSMQSTDDALREYSERGIIAMHAYVSIRLVKGWAADETDKGKGSADTIYRVAYHAAMAATTAALISPMVTKFKSDELRAFLGRQKGTKASQKASEERAKGIRSALNKLTSEGFQARKLDPWSNAIRALDPVLAPHENNDAMNKLVSREGKALFGKKWPKLAKTRQSLS
ncbi:hypothetical protein [Brevundimonas sp. 374]|uniref:hypothetical protein n=1 Tax=Brevundimonas sp. 374 TaxID=1150400 RepID=UPI000B80986D|nr:hypothetical protein [Brevundimonas sp. 374]